MLNPLRREPPSQTLPIVVLEPVKDADLCYEFVFLGRGWVAGLGEEEVCIREGR
jgi:hypothetical protein